jgi:ArsR family transcriptional regulator
MTTDVLNPVLLLKALADPNRLRIAMLLRHGELCVCELMQILELPQSTVSRHMARLKLVGLVLDRREGKWVHYSLIAGPHAPAAALRSFFDALETASPYKDDAARRQSRCATDRCAPSGTT